MTTSVVELCNIALGRVGVDPITSLNDDSTRARQCALFYPLIRDLVLEARTWRFATKRATLAPLAAAPEFDWSYQFLLPADTLMVQKAWLLTNASYEYQVDWQREGNVLLSDEQTLYITYTARIEDTLQFSPGFSSALSLRLAMELATSLRANKELRGQIMDEYERELARASAKEGRQGRSRQTYPPRLVRERR